MWRWIDTIQNYLPDNPHLTEELVLAVIAQESLGNPYAIRDEGENSSIGLMQIMDFSWRPDREWLRNPDNNIAYGMYILDLLIERYEGDVVKALAVYNCGEIGVERNICGISGGYAYSNIILKHWLPVFKEKVLQYNYGFLYKKWIRLGILR